MKLTNKHSGEVIDLDKKTPLEVHALYEDLKIKLKIFKEMEAKLKEFIIEKGAKSEEYGVLKVKQQTRFSFDTKKFESEATKQEKECIELAEKIKKEYLKGTIFYKIY